MTLMEASQNTTQHTLQGLRSQVAVLTDKLTSATQEAAIHKAQWSECVDQYTQQIDNLQNEVSVRRAENEELETEVKLIAGLTHTHAHTLKHLNNTPYNTLTDTISATFV